MMRCAAKRPGRAKTCIWGRHPAHNLRHCGRYTLAGPDVGVHNECDLDWLKIRVANLSIAQRFSLASFIAIAASSANAADLAPIAPAPVEGWTITLGAGPEV